jgi:riboflavin kinase/FMN adenylyltransferase
MGTPDDLREYGRSHGFAVVSAKLAREGDEVISSTRIRELLKAGKVAEAARLLGRPHRLEGTVISGFGRGRGLDAPTANVPFTPETALPRLGISITLSTVDGSQTYNSVTSVGTNPTFESDGKIRIETLLLTTRESCRLTIGHRLSRAHPGSADVCRRRLVGARIRRDGDSPSLISPRGATTDARGRPCS